MNRPPLPTTLPAKRTRRPGQNLTSLAPGPRGALLLPVIPKIPQSQLWIMVKRTDVSGEGGKNFILHHFLLEVLHPPHRPNRGKQIQLVNRDAKKRRKLKDQNGRERPHFFGLHPPKKFSGSLPPVLFQPRICEQPDAASGERGIACAVHLSVQLYVYSATGCIAFSPNGFAQSSECLAHIAKTPSLAGSTPLRRHRNRSGRSSPIEIHYYKACRRTMRGSTQSRMTACISGPQEGEQK